MAGRMLADGGGCARFGWDDGYLVGPRELVFATLDRLRTTVAWSCGGPRQRSSAGRELYLLILHMA